MTSAMTSLDAAIATLRHATADVAKAALETSDATREHADDAKNWGAIPREVREVLTDYLPAFTGDTTDAEIAALASDIRVAFRAARDAAHLRASLAAVGHYHAAAE